jgi:hypothetical protein
VRKKKETTKSTPPPCCPGNKFYVFDIDLSSSNDTNALLLHLYRLGTFFNLFHQSYTCSSDMQPTSHLLDYACLHQLQFHSAEESQRHPMCEVKCFLISTRNTNGTREALRLYRHPNTEQRTPYPVGVCSSTSAHQLPLREKGRSCALVDEQTRPGHGDCWGKEIFGNQSILYLHFILNSWKKVDLNEFDGLFFC